MQENIGELEQRYQALFGDYQAGRIDEATFIAEVDQLQFRDDWGRYWMIGAQSGAWHYYDGQSWRQANPAEADKLPFLDEAGRYWQKGVKSGEWYYYDPQTGEWNKPGQDDPVAPSPASTAQWPPAPNTAPQPTFDYQAPQYSQPAPDPAAQFEAGLFQDDEGRYWAMGARTGQWYFYDHEGWHPAQEFQGSGSFQPSYASYPTPAPQDSRPTQIYQSQPYQPPKNPKTQPGVAQPRQAPPVQPYTAMGPQPVQAYQTPADYQQPGVAPAYPYPTPPPAQPQPAPPPGAPNQSGSWFYFDGKQWLKYATNEPATEAPPDPRLILDQEIERPKAEPKAAAPKTEPKSESVVAEFFEEDEPPVEVVDVEVITVIEPEPDFEEEAPPVPRSAPAKPATGDEDVRPRRSKTSPIPVTPSAPSFGEPARQPRNRTASSPGISSLVPQAKVSDSTRSVSPRRRPASQEPTVILPTGGSASGISSASSRPSRPARPLHPDPRRARDITAPMPPVMPATETKEPEAAAEPVRHRQVTQAMPPVTPGVANAAAARTSTGQMKATPRAKTQDRLDPAAVAQPASAQATKEGYTFGDVLRSFPSTAWTFIGGLVVLLIVAVVIIVGAVSFMGEGNTFAFGGVSMANATPTLDVSLPDSTPTPGPTPSSEADQVVATPTAVSMATYSSPELGFTMEYPEDWELEEEETRAIVSPSERGLSAEAPEDTSLWIGMPDEESSTISELLDSILDEFPNDLEILNEGTISIAGQTWTSTQIRFDDENLGGQGIATVAVTNKDGEGYVLVALSPSEEWNSVQPLFQGVINSFRFGAEEVTVAKASPTTSAGQSARTTPDSTEEAEEATEDEEAADAEAESEAEATPTPEDTPTPEPTPTPEAAATPLVYAIQPGDTLLEIAARFGVDLDLLTTENGIDDPSGLQVGQELVIPFTAEQLEAYNEGREVSPPAAAAETTAGEEEAEAAEAEAPGAGEPEAEEETAAAPAQAPREEPAAAAAPVSGRIVYPAYSPSINSFDIWMVDLATGEQTPIAGNASQPAFNRDGSLLAYRSWERSTRGIFFRDFIGGRGGMVTRFVEDGLPAWAPDGYSFVFASRKEGDRVPRVYVGNQQSENPLSIGFNGEYASVFPDGRIVAKGCLPSGDCGMFVLGARGGGEKKISNESSDTAPAVSPDGSKIAFMSSARGARNWEIWVMNADGSNATRLTENGNNDGLPTWSPDGKSIAYVSDQGGVWAVWAMNADGSNQRKLFDMKGSPDGKVSHDEFNSRGWLEERISWAP